MQLIKSIMIKFKPNQWFMYAKNKSIQNLIQRRAIMKDTQ